MLQAERLEIKLFLRFCGLKGTLSFLRSLLNASCSAENTNMLLLNQSCCVLKDDEHFDCDQLLYVILTSLNGD